MHRHSDLTAQSTGWECAAALVSRPHFHSERTDLLLENLPAGLPAVERRRCQRLVYGVVRHAARVQAALARHVRKAPRPHLRAILLVAGFELLDRGAAPAAPIVHHAVEFSKRRTSAPETRLANAVLRKLALELDSEQPAPADFDAGRWAEHFSHPAWLISRWKETFGLEAARQLLQWNQQPAPVYARWLGAEGEATALPWLGASAWPGFYRVLEAPQEESALWRKVEAALTEGLIYLQDPGAAVAPRLLDVRPGESVLDLCSAPGGKALVMAEGLRESGRLLCVDKPGPRLDRLRSNLSRYPCTRASSNPSDSRVQVVGADLMQMNAAWFAERALPERWDAVMLDVPCSNTGVLRHRVDAKWRLQPGDIEALAQVQQALLTCAAGWVRPGGRLVYSTCSIEPEENEGVVRRFLEAAGGRFRAEASRLSLPWESGHDGAGAYLLRRIE